MTTDALFWIASQSKPITAAALMMLVDERKVRLDDPVERYLPEFEGQWLAAERGKDHLVLRKPRRPITVRHILSHTSGLPFSSALERPTLDLLPLRVAVGSYAMTPLLFEPGSRYQYANAGINTAGRIIEVVSGVPYEAFLERRLLRPLGMKDTTFRPTARQLRRLAKSYKPNARGTGLEERAITQLHYPLDDRQRQPMPAGGLISTAHDLARFCRMMLGGGVLDVKRYLSEAAVKEMTRKQTGPGVPEGYGLDWAVGDGSFGHGGAYATNMTVDTKRGLHRVAGAARRLPRRRRPRAGGVPGGGEGAVRTPAVTARTLDHDPAGHSPTPPLLWSEAVAESNNRPTACRRVYRLVVVRKNISREKPEQRLFDEVRSFFYITHELRVASRPSQVPSEGAVTSAVFSPGSGTVAIGAKDVRGRHVDLTVMRAGQRVLTPAARPYPLTGPFGQPPERFALPGPPHGCPHRLQRGRRAWDRGPGLTVAPTRWPFAHRRRLGAGCHPAAAERQGNEGLWNPGRAGARAVGNVSGRGGPSRLT
jgi:CubicO group peptidase (beta-lactamase class C family)